MRPAASSRKASPRRLVRRRWGRIVGAFGAIVVIALMLAVPAGATVRAVSTDGEATVYLDGDFSREFDLAYRISFDAAPRNHGWSVVDLLLIGKRSPVGSASAGLTRGYPDAATLAAFTAANSPGKHPTYFAAGSLCASPCIVELRGDARRIGAYIGDRRVGLWSRDALALHAPWVQLNAEVARIGDALHARVFALRAVAAGRTVRPSCAFTTQGVEARRAGDSAIVFSGTRRADARVTYLSLATGATGDRCPVR